MRRMTDEYTNIILEEMNTKFEAIMEIVVPMSKDVQKLKEITADIPEMKQDIKTIKAILKEMNAELHDHDHRLRALEAAA